LTRLELHEKFLAKSDEVCEWFNKQTATARFPIYSSYDIRDAGYKMANVDANIFPAGFNNICPADKETSPPLFKDYIESHYSGVKKILLVPEEHTGNAFYWENAITIKELMEQAGYNVQMGFAKPLAEPLQMTSATGKTIQISSAMPDSDFMKTFKPDLVVSNNDFSDPHEEWGNKIMLPLNPPRELGWYQRKKSRYFYHYNNLVNEFFGIVGEDPFSFRVETEEFPHFDINSDDSRKELASRVDLFLGKLKKSYEARGINQAPFVFVKNNSGTYGLAVIKVESGKDVLDWSYKSRKKMKAAKGGRDVEEVIIQEGIPSVVKAEGASAEPVIYMIGCQLAGGFLRSHLEKTDTESLNSPGAVYKKLCVSDLIVHPQDCPKENVYGWSAKLGLLAISKEADEMSVDFRAYKPNPCGPT
jgi:glutamate--cysteine ligase